MRISLAIFGNQNSNSGFQPLFWLNNPPQQLENIVPPGLDENSYFFTVQILERHTLFTLVQNHVSSYMSARLGVLKMAIAIPDGQRLAGGVSPMEVLLAVRRTFIDTCMTRREGPAEAYNFKEKLASPDVFDQILASYPLEPAALPHRPMTGSADALLLLDDAAISKLFIDPQYPDFHDFRRIIVANKGNASAYSAVLTGLSVPRPIRLRLVVNGKEVAWNVKDYYSQYTDILLNVDKRCWHDATLHFRVNDILEHDISTDSTSVRLDRRREVVECNIKPVPRTLNVGIDVTGIDEPSRLLTKLRIVLTNGEERAVTEQATVTLTGNEILDFYNQKLTISYTGMSFTIRQTTFLPDKGLIAVTASVSPLDTFLIAISQWYVIVALLACIIIGSVILLWPSAKPIIDTATGNN